VVPEPTAEAGDAADSPPPLVAAAAPAERGGFRHSRPSGSDGSRKPGGNGGVVRHPRARRQRRARGDGRPGPRRSRRRRCCRLRHSPRRGVSRRRARQYCDGRDIGAVGVRSHRGRGGRGPAGAIGGGRRGRLNLSRRGCSTTGPRRRRWRGRRSTGLAAHGRRVGGADQVGHRRSGDSGPAGERRCEPADGRAWPRRPPPGLSGRGRTARQATTDRAPRGGCSALRAER